MIITTMVRSLPIIVATVILGGAVLHPAVGWSVGLPPPPPPLTTATNAAPMILLSKSTSSYSSETMIALASNTAVLSTLDGQLLLQRSQQATIEANGIAQSANAIAQSANVIAQSSAQSAQLANVIAAISSIVPLGIAYASITAAQTIVAAMDLKGDLKELRSHPLFGIRPTMARKAAGLRLEIIQRKQKSPFLPDTIGSSSSYTKALEKEMARLAAITAADSNDSFSWEDEHFVKLLKNELLANRFIGRNDAAETARGEGGGDEIIRRVGIAAVSPIRRGVLQ
jgi:hypothetical protein